MERKETKKISKSEREKKPKQETCVKGVMEDIRNGEMG
jgi:NADPH-dependent 7-cyano-7-deazaguanine reductase QueF